MKLNLDTLKNEIDAYLKKAGFAVFYGMSRGMDGLPEVDWDTAHHPDFRQFAEVAKQLGVKLVVLHAQQFSGEHVESALEEVQEGSYEFDEQRQLEARLRELSMYDGFTCAIELSFDYEDTMYMFELRTEWFDEFHRILDELDLGMGEEDEGDESFGGYYSKN